MQFSDIEHRWAVRKAAAPSVAVLMKEAIAQHMGPSVISVEAITISKQFVILDSCLPALSKEGSLHIQRKQAAAERQMVIEKLQQRQGQRRRQWYTTQEETAVLQGQEEGICCDFKATLSFQKQLKQVDQYTSQTTVK